MPTLRAALANLIFYGNMMLWIIASLPALAGPPRWAMACMKGWALSTLHMLRLVVGMKWEIRGLENLPEGGCILAAKHQSTWETFALLPYLDAPTYILKKELLDLPGFGWFARRGGMIPVERSRHAQALLKMTKAARAAVQGGSQLIIFPEGTRRPVGAPPDYKSGMTHLYKQLGVPIVPVALNSGLFWPRRRFQRFPGTILVSILPAIPAGEEAREVAGRIEETIEAETARLVDEARAAPNPPPLPGPAPR